MKNPDEKCENCKFWASIPGPGKNGECRISPPIQIQVINKSCIPEIKFGWPIVEKKDWYGGWVKV